MAITTILAGAAHAADSPDDWVARMLSLEGQVDVQRPARRQWQPAEVGENYLQGDQVRTAAASRARLLFRTENYISIDQRSFLTVPEKIDPNGVTYLELSSGQLRFRSHDPSDIGVNTPFVNALHRGTEFQVEVKDDQTVITVYDGTVEAKNDLGTLSIEKGQSAIARKGEAPRLYTVVKPEDAVQWSLFYPPVIDFSQLAPAGEPFEVNRALSLYRRNQLLEALAALDAVPAEQRTGRYLNLRAGLLLTVGRVEQARPDIQEALKRDPKDATALAQLAVVAVANNDKDTALKLAEQAVAAQPKSSAAKLALSYALQSHFRLEEAREAMRTAHQDDPRNALVLTRLAELELSLADMDKGEQAAAEALSLNPKQARAKALLGFAKLMNMDTDEAIETFQDAVKDDDADPLARFGFGLAKIRNGDLDEGTQEIETAASISPDDPLIRSYLGKAYYEQKRSGPAEAEYEIAKKLDPKDPTPYFYDAIKKQTENRPVEALRDLQKAIELNGNRAVTRSKLNLDQDVATRGARLGQIHRDLGYEQLALLQGWQALSIDQTNYTAHRLLSDNYTLLPRHEIARDSELLQAQLLQQVSVNPVQPRRASDGLAFLNDSAGPSNVGFNEYARLFATNGVHLHTDLVGGSNGTFADNLILSGIKDKISYSVGQFHSQTDGYRANNDEQINITNAFVQAALSSRTSILSELRYRDRDAGDRAITFFDKNNFDQKSREQNTEWSGRIGFRHALGSASTLIGTYIHRELQTRDPGVSADRDDADLFELRHILEGDRFSVTEGVGYLAGDITIREQGTTRRYPNFSHLNGYVYGNLRPNDNAVITLGLSVDDLNDVFVSQDKPNRRVQINPKFGFFWKPTPNITLRGAAFRALKRPLVSSQTIEPTNLVGFNQFFDGFNGADDRRYGAGIDFRISPKLYSGLELSYRDSRIPDPDVGTLGYTEGLGRGYVYWVPIDNLVVSLQYQYGRISSEEFNHGNTVAGTLLGLRDSQTHSIPFGIRYFHSSGLFVRLGATYLTQYGHFSDAKSHVLLNAGDDKAVLIETAIGYRLPKRLGAISIEARNLLDDRYNFQEIDFSQNDSIARNRAILARFTFEF